MSVINRPQTEPIEPYDLSKTIQITDSAESKVLELIEEEEDEGGTGRGESQLKLRVFISPGGCQGFEYGFAFDDEVHEDDLIIKAGLVEVIVDQKRCLKYLAGSTIDYQSGIEGDKFVVYNPNAKNTCGCGASFCDK